LIYDITSQDSFENIIKWRNSFVDKGMLANASGFPFLVIGNKLDLEERERQVCKATA
jgi:Ras-related protein Rab-7A